MTLAPISNVPLPAGDHHQPVDTTSSKPVVHHLPVFGDGHGPSFKDVLDIINPLLHIPIISTIYQDLTGDVPGVAARIAGGALYGGPIGAVAAFINSAIDDHTGKTIGGYVVSGVEHLYADLTGEESGSKTELAAAHTSKSKQAANSNDSAKPVAVAMAKAAKAPVPVAGTPAPAANGLVVAEAPSPAPVHRPVVTSAPLAPLSGNTPGRNAAATVATAKSAAAKPATVTPDLHAIAAANDKMMALHGKEHFMPVPARHNFDPVQPPMIAVPLSTNGEQSNVPVVGQYTPPAYVPPAIPAKAAPAGVTPATESHAEPLAPAASPDLPKPGKGDAGTWFTSAMMANLRKYEKMNQLTKSPAAPAAPPRPSNT